MERDLHSSLPKKNVVYDARFIQSQLRSWSFRRAFRSRGNQFRAGVAHVSTRHHSHGVAYSICPRYSLRTARASSNIVHPFSELIATRSVDSQHSFRRPRNSRLCHYRAFRSAFVHEQPSIPEPTDQFPGPNSIFFMTMLRTIGHSTDSYLM